MKQLLRSIERHYRMSPLTLMRKLRQRGWFVGESWKPWEIVLKAAYALPLDESELAFFKQIAGDRQPPKTPVKKLVVIKGRRGGGSMFVAFNALFSAVCGRFPQLSPGEVGQIAIVAVNRDQAQVIFRYIEAFFDVAPFADLVEKKTQDSIPLTNGLEIAIRTASFRTIRGATLVCFIGDETAFWSVDGANPDVEILNAAVPAMATIEQSMLILVSSPYARRGVLWEHCKKHFGQDSDEVLVIQGPSLVMNPTLPESIVSQAYADDPVSADAEFGARFRSDVETFVRREAVDACTVLGRFELPCMSGVQYFAGFDAAGGSGGDEQALSIGHSEARDGRWIHVLDLIVSVHPPFSPQAVVEEFCATLKRYGISSVIGDRYAGEWPREQFVKHGIEYRLTDAPKSELYRELLPLINSNSVELLDDNKLINQLCALERRTARGGRDTIDHPPSGHDDLVNAAAIALVTSARKVALPPLQFLNVDVGPTTAAEIQAEADAAHEKRRTEGQQWLRGKIIEGGGHYFPGD